MELKEFRCEECNKLLCKGNLVCKGNMLEIKCRGCGKMCVLDGEDADIVKTRSVLIKRGDIPDPEKD